MAANEIIKNGESLFDSIQHIIEYGEEYWSARELMIALKYVQRRRLEDTINRAKTVKKPFE